MTKKESIVIRSPADTLSLIHPYGKKKQEHFGVICLDGGYGVKSRKVLFVGGTAKCQVDLKVIFWEICRREAEAVIFFHNHPAGEISPSVPDRKTTEELAEGLKTLGIQLLDHIIIGRYGYFSFLEHGLIEKPVSRLADVAEADL